MTRDTFLQADNLFELGGITMEIDQRTGILKLTFRALILRQRKSRKYGLCVVFIVE